MITLSPTALQEIQRIQTSRSSQGEQFRVKIKQGGCLDWYYVFEWVKEVDRTDRTIPLEKLTLYIEKNSYQSIEGLTIDYSEDLMGGGFRFNNPQASKTCNCGQSFSL